MPQGDSEWNLHPWVPIQLLPTDKRNAPTGLYAIADVSKRGDRIDKKHHSETRVDTIEGPSGLLFIIFYSLSTCHWSSVAQR